VKSAEEQNRNLVDDYDLRYLPYRMPLMNELDLHILNTDSALAMLGPDGRPYQHVPFKLGVSSRREQMVAQRQLPASASTSGTPSASGTPRQPNGIAAAVPPTPPNGQAISMPLQVKSVQSAMPPPANARVPSSGNGRPPSSAVPPIVPPSVPSQMTSLSIANGAIESAGSASISPETQVKLAVPKSNGLLHPHTEGTPQTQIGPDVRVSPTLPSASPSRSKPQNQHASLPVASNFQFPVNGYPAHLTPAPQYVHPGIRSATLSSAQQLQAMKAPFASMTVPHDMSAQVNAQQLRNQASYINAANGANYTAQIAAARQMQWVAAVAAQQQQQVQQQRAPINVVDANGVDTSMAAMLSPPPLPNNSPTRVPSSNGTRPMSLKPGMSSPAMNHAMSPQGRASPANTHIGRLAPHGHTSPPHLVSPSLSAAQAQASPSRAPQTTLPSPSLQARQAVGGSGSVGY